MPEAKAFVELLDKTGYWNFYVDMTDQQRFDLLGGKFWVLVGALGFDVSKLKVLCWKYAGRPRDDLVAVLLS